MDQQGLFSLNGRIASQREYESIFPVSATACFTSFRAHVARGEVRVLHWDWHTKRLQADSCFLYFGSPKFDDVWRVIERSSHELEPNQNREDVRVRVDLVSGCYGIRVSKISRLDVSPQAISLATVRHLRPSPSHKTFEAAKVSLSAMLQIEQRADEALMISPMGEVHEGAWSNFGWITADNKVMITPFGLNGVTQRIIPELIAFAGLDCGFGGAASINVFDSQFSSIYPFVMSSVRGIVPVARVDERTLASSAQVLRLAEAYRGLLYES